LNLETKWLEDFVALAATRSFSQAAQRRFVTQPAVSRRIRSLEEALGLQLINRSRTPIELTEAGQLFLVSARNMVEQLGEVVRHLHHVEGQQGEVLQISAAHSLALGFFPAWIAGLRHEGLNLATRLIATNVGEAVHVLREGGCDLILAYYDPDAALQLDPELFPSLHLGRTEMLPVCAVGPDGTPLYDVSHGRQPEKHGAAGAGDRLGAAVECGAGTRARRAGDLWRRAVASAAGNSPVSLLADAQGGGAPALATTGEPRHRYRVSCRRSAG